MISIIIPCYNSQKTIEKCLQSVLNQSISEGFEVIVVNDGSTDGTEQIVQELARKNDKIKYFYQSNAGPAKARNLGAKKAIGSTIIFLDSDCIPQKDWLKEMIAPFKDQNVVGVQGSYISSQKEISAILNQLEIEERYELMKKSKQLDWIATYSAAYKKDIFMKEGMFDESFPLASGEDTEFSFKLSEKGYKLVFNQNAVVEHFHPGTILKLLKIKFLRAYWRTLLYRMHPGKMVKDSYTPQTLKLGIILAGIQLLGILALMAWNETGFLQDFLNLTFIGFVVLEMSFLRRIVQKTHNIFVLIFGMVYVNLRSYAFGFGLLWGTLRGVWMK